jgi:hypothetical protein
MAAPTMEWVSESSIEAHAQANANKQTDVGLFQVGAATQVIARSTIIIPTSHHPKAALQCFTVSSLLKFRRLHTCPLSNICIQYLMVGCPSWDINGSKDGHSITH